MIRHFERAIDPFKYATFDQPPSRLGPFYWHFVRQVWPAFLAIMIVGFFAAMVEIALFAFLGQLVDLMRAAESPASFLSDHGLTLIWMAFVALILRPVVFALHILLVNQGVTASFTNLIRWQTHGYVLRQSLAFFQNDFAGRIASKIMQTGPALRESVVQLVDTIWFVLIYTVSALFIFLEADVRLIIPLLLWLVAFTAVLFVFVPRIKDRAVVMSESRSMLTGRIVDSYTNVLTIKLFPHRDREDIYARETLQDHNEKFLAQLRMTTVLEIIVWSLNGGLIVATTGLAVWLWGEGRISLGAIALASGLVIRINNMAGWIMWVVTGIFENIGTVQEGMETISSARTVVDRPEAPALDVTSGEIRFEQVRFHYGRESGIIEDLSLRIAPGEKVGLVGRSGAGKSTLVHLLLRFYDLERGRILIDGQDISAVTQDSLRARIGMVTQEASLLHRSVMDNIRYGRVDADEAAVVAAARKAHAHDFILELADAKGRTGYDAHVGERGVKLSGGQRQRITIARMLLKNAPILILDEATSALDSEVEAAIQEQLYNLMQGKTVIAIAHRLSTIAAMDRLVVMDQGRIAEEGSHDALIRKGGLYAALWARQSGGFLQQVPAA